MPRIHPLLVLCLGCTLAAAAQEHGVTAVSSPPAPAQVALPAESSARLREVLLEGANRTEANLGIAADLPNATLLEQLIERELAADEPRKALSTTQLHALEQRLGIPLPTALKSLLQTAGAWQALGWTDPEMIVRAESLGEVFISEIEASGDDWRQQRVELMDDDGTSFHVPAGDFAHYLVVSRRPEFGNLILYDPSPSPKHPRCVIIETTLFDDHLHSAYANLREYLESEWALGETLLK